MTKGESGWILRFTGRVPFFRRCCLPVLNDSTISPPVRPCIPFSGLVWPKCNQCICDINMYSHTYSDYLIKYPLILSSRYKESKEEVILDGIRSMGCNKSRWHGERIPDLLNLHCSTSNWMLISQWLLLNFSSHHLRSFWPFYGSDIIYCIWNPNSLTITTKTVHWNLHNLWISHSCRIIEFPQKFSVIKGLGLADWLCSSKIQIDHHNH